MKINVVMGFFLPMPPVGGGATEKSWHHLAVEFARRGHRVTVLSRRWPGWKDRETLNGVDHVRLPGKNHSRLLALNLCRDLVWSVRTGLRLPLADVSVVNCVTLPAWLGRRRGRAGRVVVMTGRMPKGQYRLYGAVDRVLAVSSAVRTAVLAENAGLASRVRVVGYPIQARSLAAARPPPAAGAAAVLGYVGRIHREKGLDLLADALGILAKRESVPPWRLILCGPQSVREGGSGEGYARELAGKLAARLKPGSWELRPPDYDEDSLAALYRQIDIFCYPSLAAGGETFGVAIAEAMAAGAVPVVSSLNCFRDLVRAGDNGESFATDGPEAAANLAGLLEKLLLDPTRRSSLAGAAHATAQLYDLPAYADRLLRDFSEL